jgi:hypothetical protein
MRIMYLETGLNKIKKKPGIRIADSFITFLEMTLLRLLSMASTEAVVSRSENSNTK